MANCSKSFSRSLLLNMSILVAVSIGLLGYFWISREYERFAIEAEEMRTRQLGLRKEELKEQVDAALDYIVFKRSQSEERIRENIRLRVYEAHDIASHFHETFGGQKSETELKEMVREALRPIRFNKGKGYYFATSHAGIEQLFAARPELEGKDMLSTRDSKGAFVIRDMIRLAEEKGEGFYSYRWTKPQAEGDDYQKISFIKYFAPFDWFIGTGAYVDDMDKEIQQEVLTWADRVHFGREGRLMIGQWDGLCLTGPAKGRNIFENADLNREKFIEYIIERARESGGFVSYVKDRDGAGCLMLSYTRGIEDWQWFVAAQDCLDDIEKSIGLAKAAMVERVKYNIIWILFVLTVLLAVSLFIARRITNKTRAHFAAFTSFFDRAATEALEMRTDRLEYIEFAQLAQAANHMLDERKRAVTRLTENEKKYRALFESAGDAIFIGKDDEVVDCNRKTLEMFGCRREEILGLSPDRFSPLRQPDGSDSGMKSREKIQAAMRGEPQFFEWTHQRFDGTLFEADVSLNAIEVGGFVYIQGIVRDITHRKRAEKQLIRLASAIEQAAEEILITDNEGLIEYVNPAFCRITGYGSAEVIGRADDFLRNGTGDPLYEEMWDIVRQGKVWRGRIVSRVKDGSLIDEDAAVSPVVDPNGNRMGYVFVKRDVTEQVRLEQMFRQSQKMEAIGTLAGGIAHDFNNVLAAIFGFAEIAKIESGDQSRAQHSLAKILEAAGRARDLVKQILAFSRQTETAPKPIRIKSITKEVTKLLKASLPSTIEIHSDLRADEAVMADPTSIHQILMNLSANAGHAMRGKGGILTITLVKVSLDGDFVQHYPGVRAGNFLKLSVGDTGHGIRAELMERIFDPFFTTKREGEGTGMGLSVVHGIVKGAGGIITVESEMGKGTVFNVYLPVYQEEVVEEVDREEPLPLGRERILMVDDEEALVDIGRQFLETLGYTVHTCTSSVEALQFFQEQPDAIDLLITDYTMPRMTGIDLAGRILVVRPDLPVILCTGNNVDITEREIRRAGISENILKPVMRRELATVVRQVLDRAGPGRRGGSTS